MRRANCRKEKGRMYEMNLREVLAESKRRKK